MLEVSGLSVSYGPVRALSGISLDVREGEIAALVGANGAGKSSLIHAVAGLVPAGAGKVAFRGETCWDCPATASSGAALRSAPRDAWYWAALRSRRT